MEPKNYGARGESVHRPLKGRHTRRGSGGMLIRATNERAGVVRKKNRARNKRARISRRLNRK